MPLWWVSQLLVIRYFIDARQQNITFEPFLFQTMTFINNVHWGTYGRAYGNPLDHRLWPLSTFDIKQSILCNMSIFFPQILLSQ